MTVAPAWESEPGAIIRGYFEQVWRILTKPSVFFRRMPLRGGLAGPLTFALVTHWLGAALGYVSSSLVGGGLERMFSSYWKQFGDLEINSPGRHADLLHAQDRLLQWFWGTGSVIADPFFTLASILITSFLVYLGARILVTPGGDSESPNVGESSPSEISYESALRIVAYGMTPAILAALPLFGHALAPLAVVIVTVIAAKEVYRIRTGRALLVALFPKVLFLGIMILGFLGLFVFALAFVKMLLSST